MHNDESVKEKAPVLDHDLTHDSLQAANRPADSSQVEHPTLPPLRCRPGRLIIIVITVASLLWVMVWLGELAWEQQVASLGKIFSGQFTWSDLLWAFSTPLRPILFLSILIISGGVVAATRK